MELCSIKRDHRKMVAASDLPSLSFSLGETPSRIARLQVFVLGVVKRTFRYPHDDFSYKCRLSIKHIGYDTYL